MEVCLLHPRGALCTLRCWSQVLAKGSEGSPILKRPQPHICLQLTSHVSPPLYTETLQENYQLKAVHIPCLLTLSVRLPPVVLTSSPPGCPPDRIRLSVPRPHLTGIDVASHSLSLETFLALGFWSRSILVLVLLAGYSLPASSADSFLSP